jgi:hypothetical protein
LIARHIADGDILGLIKFWLQSLVETTDGNGVKRVERGKAVKRGVPQAASSARCWRTSTLTDATDARTT